MYLDPKHLQNEIYSIPKNLRPILLNTNIAHPAAI
jgi:hypothetical protein